MRKSRAASGWPRRELVCPGRKRGARAESPGAGTRTGVVPRVGRSSEPFSVGGVVATLRY